MHVVGGPLLMPVVGGPLLIHVVVGKSPTHPPTKPPPTPPPTQAADNAECIQDGDCKSGACAKIDLNSGGKSACKPASGFTSELRSIWPPTKATTKKIISTTPASCFSKTNERDFGVCPPELANESQSRNLQKKSDELKAQVIKEVKQALKINCGQFKTLLTVSDPKCDQICANQLAGF